MLIKSVTKGLIASISAFITIGCTQGLYQSTIALENHKQYKAISYDMEVEYIETNEPLSYVKVIEYRSRGSESPQISQILTFYCTFDNDNDETCRIITDPVTVSGSGLLNDTLAGIGSAAVTGGAFVGGSYLRNPDGFNNNTTLDNTNKTSSQSDSDASNTNVNDITNRQVHDTNITLDNKTTNDNSKIVNKTNSDNIAISNKNIIKNNKRKR